MYQAIDIAVYILKRQPTSSMKLQQLLYLAQELSLLRGKRLFSDDFQAWPNGPILPLVYDKFEAFPCGDIHLPEDYKSGTEIDPETTKLIDCVLLRDGGRDSWSLSLELKRVGGAWHTVYQGGKGNKKTIPTDLIKRLAR